MSLAYKDCTQLYCVRCEDVGLDCSCIIYGINEGQVTETTILHLFENHAIQPEEMTTCMKLKIKTNIHAHPFPSILCQLEYNNHFGES
jgi:predicted small metal-binding protein